MAPHHPKSRILPAAGFCCVLALAMFIAGLQYFAHEIRRGAAVEPHSGGDAVAVVVITGARGRIEAGARLMLESGAAGPGTQARRMLISGIGAGVGPGDILRIAALNGDDAGRFAAMLACCVDLGGAARDTRGNAQEAIAWARAHGFGAIILVTSDFHMPRALRAFRKALAADDNGREAALTIHPHAVATQGPGLDGNGRSMWWRSAGSILTLAREYGKYLAAFFY